MANPYLDFFENPYTKNIGAAHAKAMYEGPEAIVNTTPGGLDYHIRANADVSQRISDALKQGNAPLTSLAYDLFSPVSAGIVSIPYDLKQAYDRMEPGSGLTGFGKSWWGENPGTAILGRTIGAAQPLAKRLGFFGQQYDPEKGTIAFDPNKINETGMSDMYPFANIPSYLLTKMLPKGLKYLQQKFKNRQGTQNAHEELRNQIINQRAAANQVRQNIQTYGSGDRPNTGMNRPGGGKGQSPTGGDVAGTPFSRGGILGAF